MYLYQHRYTRLLVSLLPINSVPLHARKQHLGHVIPLRLKQSAHLCKDVFDIPVTWQNGVPVGAWQNGVPVVWQNGGWLDIFHLGLPGPEAVGVITKVRNGPSAEANQCFIVCFVTIRVFLFLNFFSVFFLCVPFSLFFSFMCLLYSVYDFIINK